MTETTTPQGLVESAIYLALDSVLFSFSIMRYIDITSGLFLKWIPLFIRPTIIDFLLLLPLSMEFDTFASSLSLKTFLVLFYLFHFLNLVKKSILYLCSLIMVDGAALVVVVSDCIAVVVKI